MARTTPRIESVLTRKTAITFALCLASSFVQINPSALPGTSSLVLTNVNVVDLSRGGIQKDVAVLIEGDRIKAISPARKLRVPPTARVVEGGGRFVIPGLADMHNHLGDGFNVERDYRRNLAEMLRWGFTTLFSPGYANPDLASYTSLRTASEQDWPRFYGVGRSISVKGGHGSQFSAFLPESTDEVPAIIAAQKAAGADAIKLISGDHAHIGRNLPTMQPDIMAAIIRETHKAGLKLYVHAPQLKYAKEALRAGADGLVHAVSDAPVDDEFISLLKKNRAVYVTTHSILRSFVDLPAWIESLQKLDVNRRIPTSVYDELKRGKPLGHAPEQHLQYAANNLRRVYDAGILVVAGTDTGVRGVVVGVSSQMKLVLLVEDGLTPVEALRTATVNAARMLGLQADFGLVAPGKIADLVVLRKDPLADIRNITSIDLVIKGGRVHDSSEWRNREWRSS